MANIDPKAFDFGFNAKHQRPEARGMRGASPMAYRLKEASGSMHWALQYGQANQGHRRVSGSLAHPNCFGGNGAVMRPLTPSWIEKGA